MTAAVHALHHPEPLPLASRKDLLGVGEADPATGIRHSLPALHGLLSDLGFSYHHLQPGPLAVAAPPGIAGTSLLY